MKVVDLPERKNETRAAVERVRREFDDIVAGAAMMAKVRRAYFLAYVAEGFTVAEALELCKAL